MKSDKVFIASQTPQPKTPAFWEIIRASLSGAEYAYTSGGIRRALLLLAIPMVLEMGMESIFVLVDIFVVAQLGVGAVATVGLTESMLTLLYAVAIGLSDLTVRFSLMLRLLRVSVPDAIQMSIAMTSYIFLMKVIASYGSNAVAGFTIGIRIFAFTFLPAWGLGNAVATLVGQNLGAGRPDRAERSIWIAARYNATVFVTIPITDSLLAVVAVIALRRGHWKRRKV